MLTNSPELTAECLEALEHRPFYWYEGGATAPSSPFHHGQLAFARALTAPDINEVSVEPPFADPLDFERAEHAVDELLIHQRKQLIEKPESRLDRLFLDVLSGTGLELPTQTPFCLKWGPKDENNRDIHVVPVSELPDSVRRIRRRYERFPSPFDEAKRRLVGHNVLGIAAAYRDGDKLVAGFLAPYQLVEGVRYVGQAIRTSRSVPGVAHAEGAVEFASYFPRDVTEQWTYSHEFVSHVLALTLSDPSERSPMPESPAALEDEGVNAFAIAMVQ